MIQNIMTLVQIQNVLINFLFLFFIFIILSVYKYLLYLELYIPSFSQWIEYKFS